MFGDTISEERSAKTPNLWMAVSAVSLSSSVFVATEMLPVGLLNHVTADFGVSAGAAGLMTTLPALVAIAAPGFPVAMGKADRRHVLVALTILLILANFVSAFASDFAVLLAARALFGIGLGGFWVIGAGLGSRLVEEKAIGRATATIFAGVSIGALLGVPAGAFISEILGWRAAFASAALVSVAALLTQLTFVPSLKVDRAVILRDFLGMLSKRAGVLGLVAMLFVVSAQFATYTYVAAFLDQISGFDGTTISALLLGYTIVGVIGNFMGGAGATRNVKWSLLSSILLLAVSVALFPIFGTQQAATIGLLATWGLAYGAVPISLQMWMAKASPDTQEGNMALFIGNFQISIASGSFLGGVAVDWVGVSNSMYAGAIAAVVSALVLISIRTSTGKRVTEKQELAPQSA
ncbi:MFS transporter [Mesorhizobium sp. B2-3-5]|uniref:MFS transporter n=1 Tax=Mesorhizobium sp. B2-3-5 TaxID=2589958 RepID=UPI0011262499|nr:MFS transporter [Mesorhizobium sp. B2-3-5]TPM26890.1 MFS transporter [Mesorhizobium sp. B2-3-5]